MVEQPNDGGPVFPLPEDLNWRGHDRHGMSMRQHYAAVALPQVMALCFTDTRRPGESLEDYFARRAFDIADAMLRAQDATGAGTPDGGQHG